MSKLRKNTIDWLCNQREIENLISSLGARNLTVIYAVHITSTTEYAFASYDKMIQHESKEADLEAIKWCKEKIEKHSTDQDYVYFRLVRWN